MFKVKLDNNRFLIFSIIITSIIQLIIVTNQIFANFFGLVTVPIENAIVLLLLTIPLIITMEIFKTAIHHKS